MGEYKDIAIDNMNKTLSGIVIYLRKKVLTTYEIDLKYNGQPVKVNLLEKEVNGTKLYKLNIIESKIVLSSQDKKDILEFIVKN